MIDIEKWKEQHIPAIFHTCSKVDMDVVGDIIHIILDQAQRAEYNEYTLAQTNDETCYCIITRQSTILACQLDYVDINTTYMFYINQLLNQHGMRLNWRLDTDHADNWFVIYTLSIDVSKDQADKLMQVES